PAVLRSPAYRSAGSRVLHPFPTRRSSDLGVVPGRFGDALDLLCDLAVADLRLRLRLHRLLQLLLRQIGAAPLVDQRPLQCLQRGDRKSTRLNSSHVKISYAVFCLKKKTLA